MFQDSQCELANALALTVGTTLFTNAYDLGASPVAGGRQRDPTIGEGIGVGFEVISGAVVSGGETYEFDLVQSDDAAQVTNLEVLAKYTFTNAQATALLKTGKIIGFHWPVGIVTRRFIGMQAVLTVGTAAITVTARIQPDNMMQHWRDYATLIQIL